jgi:hypothetical protein
MSTYGILSQSAEDALHPTRLLGIEERPFQRVTKRLLDRDSLLRSTPKQLPSPPPESVDETSPTTEDAAADSHTRQKFREEVLLDFAALESSITLGYGAGSEGEYAAAAGTIGRGAEGA